MKRVRCFGYIRAVVMGIYNISGPFMAYITFLAYATRGGYIAAEDAFLTLALLRALRVSMVLFYPFCIQLINEASVSLSRIQVFESRLEKGPDSRWQLGKEILTMLRLQPLDQLCVLLFIARQIFTSPH